MVIALLLTVALEISPDQEPPGIRCSAEGEKHIYCEFFNAGDYPLSDPYWLLEEPHRKKLHRKRLHPLSGADWAQFDLPGKKWSKIWFFVWIDKRIVYPICVWAIPVGGVIVNDIRHRGPKAGLRKCDEQKPWFWSDLEGIIEHEFELRGGELPSWLTRDRDEEPKAEPFQWPWDLGEDPPGGGHHPDLHGL